MWRPSVLSCLLPAALAVLATDSPAQPLPTVVPRAGLVITRSVRVQPGTYRLTAHPSLDSALLVVRGDDLTVDMRGVRLVGIPEGADPDGAAGVAVRVDGGRNVRILGAAIRGYKVGILARGTRGLVLADNDVSYNWKPRLFSGRAHESLVDWLSYHKNEGDEWLRFGAGIYLADVRGGEVRGNRGEQGMNALLMTRTDSLLVWNNSFSFNSGLGIGMYRSSGNRIMHNAADYNVRGYSHGFYRRGQDSAALLMFEQCTNNVVAFNSMTHSGDGLFLWAGQHTMDTGEGGSNDNLFYANDFSYAPTNGMEATFSRNRFIGNRVTSSDHGLWGGYSFGSEILGNAFGGNRIGVAIEHGQENRVERNDFSANATAIRLWGNALEPSDWGYPKHRDTRSRDYRVVGNRFVGGDVALRAARTSGLAVEGNDFVSVDSTTALGDSVELAMEFNDIVDRLTDPGVPAPPTLPDSLRAQMPAPLPGGVDTRSARAALPNAFLIVDEWGPHDWRSPRLRRADSSAGPVVALDIQLPIGPSRDLDGRWRVVDRRNVAALSADAGRASGRLLVTPAAGAAGDWSITLEYVGGEVVSPRGLRTPAGAPVRFSYDVFDLPIDWRARWFAWRDSAADPTRDTTTLAALLGGAPVLETRPTQLDLEGSGALLPGLPRERLLLEATGRITLADGVYTLRTISDDAIRVWVDRRLVIDAWAPHESAVDYASLTGGTHDLRVVYAQVGGWHELRLDVLRGNAPRSAGSPGPH